MICDSLVETVLENHDENFELSDGEFVENLKLFNQIDWLGKQSFCWKDEKYVELHQILTMSGICFSFNRNENLLIQEK